MHKDYVRFPHDENSNQIIKENNAQDLPIIITMAYKDHLINSYVVAYGYSDSAEFIIKIFDPNNRNKNYKFFPRESW